eukprot:767910-Hanusia_phi.AAC.1
MLEAVKRAKIAFDYPVAKLKQGHGEAVCVLLNLLCNGAIDAKGMTARGGVKNVSIGRRQGGPRKRVMEERERGGARGREDLLDRKRREQQNSLSSCSRANDSQAFVLPLLSTRPTLIPMRHLSTTRRMLGQTSLTRERGGRGGDVLRRGRIDGEQERGGG